MKPDINTARTITCEVFGITIDEFVSRRRTKRIADARMALAVVLTQKYGFTHEEAAVYTCRTRGNITKCKKSADSYCRTDPHYAESVVELIDALKEKMRLTYSHS